MSDELTQLARFEEELRHRMKKGHDEYGGASFQASPLRLLKELKEEALDIAGWGYILWKRLDNIERRMSHMDWEAWCEEREQATVQEAPSDDGPGVSSSR